MSNNYRGQRSSGKSYRGGRNSYRSRGRSNRYGTSQKIPHSKYISKADETYTEPSIYMEEIVYGHYDLDNRLQQNIKNKGFIHPTKIQHQAIPIIQSEKDIIGLASTGTGKTGAFLIPTIDKILRRPTQKALIIVPTRELATQIQDELRDLTKGLRIYSTVVIGGKSIRGQIDQIRRNPQFIIGTPGRLKDLHERNALRLNEFNNIILDEVDRMLDMGFVPDVSLLISNLQKQRQSMFFSATITNETEKIARDLLNDPVRIQVQKEEAYRNVHQDIVKVPQNQKMEALMKILKADEVEKVLIFSRTKRGADRLAKDISESSNMRIQAIHGGKSQGQRQRILDDFKANRIEALVATDVAARGWDIPNVSHVINYDEPENYKDYIHRIGRTGRAGKTGIALTFVR